MLEIYNVFKFELFKFFKTARGYLLLLTGTIPLILFLSISAEKARVDIIVHSLSFVQDGLLTAYVLYSYIIAIFFILMLFSDIVSNEKTYEFLLVSTSRLKIVLGKLLASFILTFLLLLEMFFSFLIILYSYNIPFPDVGLLLEAFMLSLFFTTFIVLPIILISNTIIIKLGIASSMANYLGMFIFFVIPFLIYFATFDLQIFQADMLNYSIHTFIYTSVADILISHSGTIPFSQLNNLENITILGIIVYLIGIVLFIKSSIVE